MRHLDNQKGSREAILSLCISCLVDRYYYFFILTAIALVPVLLPYTVSANPGTMCRITAVHRECKNLILTPQSPISIENANDHTVFIAFSKTSEEDIDLNTTVQAKNGIDKGNILYLLTFHKQYHIFPASSNIEISAESGAINVYVHACQESHCTKLVKEHNDYRELGEDMR